MQPRKPAVSGQFYSDNNRTCLKEIKMCLEDRNIPKQLPDTIVAGIVPHAGWMFSGDVAALVFNTIRSVHKHVDTFIIFGAVHYPYGKGAAVYGKGAWQTPLGEVAIDEAVAAAIVESCLSGEENERTPIGTQYRSAGAVYPVSFPRSENCADHGSARGIRRQFRRRGGPGDRLETQRRQKNRLYRLNRFNTLRPAIRL